MRSHSLEQSNKDSGNCNPYASSPVVIPNVDSSDLAAARVNGDCPSPAPAVPPSGYVLAGQMNLGAINVPALNSANLSELDAFLLTISVPFSSHFKFVRCFPNPYFVFMNLNPPPSLILVWESFCYFNDFYLIC